MRRLERLRSLWRDVRHRDLVEHALDAELTSYVELLAAEHERRGMPPADALRAARAEAGDVERVKEQVRAGRVDRWLYTALPDARHTLRALRRAPTFALIAITTLAVGIGGTTGIFALADAALLRPLPGVRAPERLVGLTRVQAADTFGNFGYPDFAAYHDAIAHGDARALDGIAGHRIAGIGVRATTPIQVAGDVVTADYFSLLGARASLGRLLGPADDRAGTATVVLSHAFWRRTLGADSGIIGRTLSLNGRPFTVVGVAVPEFVGVSPAEPIALWIPMSALRVAMPTLSADVLHDRAAGWLELFARRRDDTALNEAQAELATIAARLAAEFPANARRTVRIEPQLGLGPDDRAEVGNVLVLLGGAVTLLLVATCANVAGLLLVRMVARRREVAMRLAIGATRARLLRQLLVEGLILALVAAPLAVTVAFGVARVATAAQPDASVLRALDVTPDLRVLAFAIGTAMVVGAAIALVPALRVSRAAPAGVLAATATRAGSGRSHLRRMLVAAQIAVSVVLLVATGVTLGAVHDALAAGPGFDAARLALASIDLGMRGYDDAHGAAVETRLLEQLRSAPGIVGATLAKTMPPREWSEGASVFLPGEEPPRSVLHDREFELGTRVRVNRIAPGYFATLGIPLLRGREFAAHDDAAAAPVAVVSQRLVHRVWAHDEDPIGRQLAWPDPYGPSRRPLTIIGIVADVRHRSLTEPPPPLLYVPLTQAYDTRVTIAARAASDAGDASRAIARVVQEIDPELPLLAPHTMQRHLESSLWRQRTAALWVTAFGVLAVLLAALGLYGVTAQAVEQERHEHSVRLALGADPSRIARGILGCGLAIAALGLAIGLPLALVIAALVRSALAGTPSAGIVVPSGAAAIVVVVTIVACLAPAYRAARAQPADALRGH